MSELSLAAFDRTVQLTNLWLKELMNRLGSEDRSAAYHAMRVVLHALRDQLTVDETAALAAQLPMLIRGIFYEGWRPSGKHAKFRKREEFLVHVRQQLGQYSITETERVLQAVFGVLAQHITEGEVKDVKNILPQELRSFWPDEYFSAKRHEMITHQLQRRKISDPLILQVMEQVPREEFVPKAMQSEAYSDYPLPIGFGQTISQPYTVAYMLELLRLQGNEKVLEIGTGSGYQAALLSRLVPEVHTAERIPQLADQAQKRIKKLGYDNVHIHVVDGSLGLPDQAPFDAIVVTACAENLPQPLVDQLAVGGRLVIPLGGHPHYQKLYRFTLRDGELEREDLGSFGFVPLIGKHGWDE